MPDEFLRQQARTQHFTLGAPRHLTLSKTGEKLFFVRAKTGEDSRGCLWMIEITEEKPSEQLLVDPSALAEEENVSPAEQRRRERAREAAGGIVSFSIDDRGDKVAFVLGSDLYVLDTRPVNLRRVAGGEEIFDPRISPDGRHIAYVSDGNLRVLSTQASAAPRTLAHDDDQEITWGMADFIAAEEMDRLRGFWWSPDSHMLIAERVDNNPIKQWHIANPASPESEPAKIRYPAAGTANARLQLSLVTLDGRHIPVQWDADQFEYVADVMWRETTPLVVVQSRDQKTVQLREVDISSGDTALLEEMTDPNWVELLPGVPSRGKDGALIRLVPQETWRLQIGDDIVTPPGLTVREVLALLEDGSVLFSAHQGDPKAWHIWQITKEGQLLTVTSEPGVHQAAARGMTLLLHSQNLADTKVTTALFRWQNGEWRRYAQVASHAGAPPVKIRPAFSQSKSRKLETALLLPENYNGDAPLPVIMDPYGGPHAQRVIAALRAYASPQWWANQGFAVVVVDGRGTPGRGPKWEKAIAGDLITPILEDQIEALQDLAAHDDRLDLKRVGIKGWSFGGYLAAYAVVRHPEVFHAAVAGAPVTDWRLYDTHYAERYLGDPAKNAAAYDSCALLKEAHKLERPLLLIHGFADDNVVVAHTLQFSSALLAAGRSHQVLPLSGATHMASGETLMVNLQKLELDFFKQQVQGIARHK